VAETREEEEEEAEAEVIEEEEEEVEIEEETEEEVETEEEEDPEEEVHQEVETPQPLLLQPSDLRQFSSKTKMVNIIEKISREILSFIKYTELVLYQLKYS